jgi:hypothetical protein
MGIFGKNCFAAVVLVVANLCFSLAFNSHARIISIASKRIATSAIVAIGLIGLPDQITSFSPVSIAHAAEEKSVKSVFAGFYEDPNHPGMKREITNKGIVVTLQGSDNKDGSNPFTIMAKESYPGTIFVDFSPKGGPPNLLGVFDETTNSIKVKAESSLFIIIILIL